MNSKKFRFIGALLAGALLAGCGGGGGARTSALPTSAATAPAVSGAQSGTRLTFSFSRAKPTHKTVGSAYKRKTTGLVHAAAKTASSTRQPKYISNDAQGLQITSTSGTSAPTTLYFNISQESYNCTYNATTYVETCGVTVPAPTTGSTQTISAIEVDEAPIGQNAIGEGTGFPTYSHVLAVGSTTVTLSPGALTVAPLSLNPVYSALADCGTFINGTANDGLDNEQGSSRIVVTAGVASSTELYAYGPGDFDGDCIFPIYNEVKSHARSPKDFGDNGVTGQAFVDVNGTAVAATATSSTSHFTFVIPAEGTPPTSTAGYSTTASMPSSSFTDIAENDECFFATFFQYDGGATSGDTLTFSNNLTAATPVFSASLAPNAGPNPATYAFSYAYSIAAISVAPSTLTFSSAVAQNVTGSDPGENPSSPMNSDSTCTDSAGNTVANITSVAGDTFAVTPVTLPYGTATPDTCQFLLYDGATNVQTLPVTVTSSLVAPPPP